jgi:hypothetical protein
MKSAPDAEPPTTVNLTVKRRYLTEREIERLMDCARKHSRHGHRDATMILVTYRHVWRSALRRRRLARWRPRHPLPSILHPSPDPNLWPTDDVGNHASTQKCR